MEKKDTIKIILDLGEVCDDLVTSCNQISKSLGTEVSAEIKADVATPDSEETKSLICRAVTEAIGNLKYAAQRYLRTGRTEDTNALERLGRAETHEQIDDEGEPTGEVSEVIKYESVSFEMIIPNFNLAVTDALKSAMHKYTVDYVMWRFLQNQLNEKAGEYKTLADQEDLPDVIVKLNARTSIRKPRFV